MHAQPALASPAFSAHSHLHSHSHSQLHPLNQHSALLSTPGNPPNPIQVVHFEEFEVSQQRPSLKGQGKKKLTIEVEENYEYEQVSMHVVEPSPNCDSSLNVLGRNAEKTHEFQLLRQKLAIAQRERDRVLEENDLLRALLRKKEEQLLSEADRNEELQLRVGQLEAEAVEDRFYDQKLREKEAKMRQLQKIHEKVVAMNKALQRELRESDRKLLQMEKEMQRTIWSNRHDTFTKIKQSSKMKDSLVKAHCNNNKENTLPNAKSVERKKVSSSQLKKTTRTPSSAHPLPKKTQSKSPII